MFNKKTGLQLVSLWHENSNLPNAKGNSQFIYDKYAWKKELKEIYDARLKLNLKSLIKEIYGDDTIPNDSKYVMLSSSQKNDAGQTFKIPQILFRF